MTILIQNHCRNGSVGPGIFSSVIIPAKISATGKVDCKKCSREKSDNPQQLPPGSDEDCLLPQQIEYCNLAVIFVSEHFNVPLNLIMCKSRANAKAAIARQIAIYVAHTTFSITYGEAALYFGRDRTTIAHACKKIEDKRDNVNFDAKLGLVETIVEQAAAFTRIRQSQCAEFSSSPAGKSGQ